MATTQHRHEHGTTHLAESPVREIALLYGVVLLVVGGLGFIPGITTDYDSMSFAMSDSNAQLFGLFEVSVLHNIVHLAYGVIGIAMASAVASARTYLFVGGIIFLALWLYGLLIDKSSDANFLPMDTADDWLHFGLGVSMVLLSFLPRTWHRSGPASGHPG